MPSKVIFIVDDEAVIADTLALILHRSGFVAKSFHQPAEVLKAAELVVPDLLISDVFMPDMDGIELAKRIRLQHPECKLCLFSGHAATRNMLETAQDDFAFEILQKPIYPTDLLARIHDML
jgi:DNA-binding NtrC family response regulator